MENRRGIFVSTVSQVAVRLVGLAIALVSIKLLTNYLGRDGTGDYNAISTYLNFAIVIADLGLFSSAVREISRDREQEQRILGNVLSIRAITALLASLLAAGLVELTDYSPSVKLGTVIATGFIFCNLLASTWDIVLQERLKMQYSALAELLSKIGSLIALYIAIRLNAGFLWVVSTVTFSGVIILVMKWLLSRHLVRFRPRLDKETALWVMRISLPLGMVFIVNNLYFKVDTLILFQVKGSGAVGIYSVAFKVLEVTTFVAAYFASSLKPLLSRRIEHDAAGVGAIVSRGLLLMFSMSLPIAILASVFSRNIILFLSKPEFLAGSGALILLSWTLPAIYGDILLGEVLVAKNARNILLGVSAAMLTTNLLLNLYFIPRYSYYGAAFTTMLSEFILLAINVTIIRKLVPLRFELSAYLRLAGCAIGMAAIALLTRLLPVYFLIQMAISLAGYLGLAYLFQLLRPQEVLRLIKER